ncbi:MAG: Sensory box protein [Candidatus Wolfebacteria bacterium GW2011_GWC2_39_22]|uniref:histidine kinase n=1 Tax=Candidatus Wolfebacteria bacterium GW2011_GWC2_39_22 TaxID=1619013 RepID=A0A0G0N7S0_9BACT|nr:MAG: Sensory box protein [Candidatus Wolfebacteria bacterium GW2011_GWC2_39_22]
MVQEATTQPEGKKEGGSLLQLAAIVEESHDAIIGKTLDGIITSWNGGATKMFGYLPEEVIGKPMTNLFPPELKDELPRLLEKVRRGEIIADYDSIWLRKDGTRADVEFSISPVHTEGSAIIGASLVGRDITARKTAEESMRQTQLIVENSYDAGGAAKMFGYTAQESIGKNISFLAPPEMQDEMPKLLERIKAGEVIADYDTVRVRKDGSRIAVALSISPIKTEDGAIIGASLVKRDIRARKKAEESMRQIQLIVENSYDAIIGERWRSKNVWLYGTRINWQKHFLLGAA